MVVALDEVIESYYLETVEGLFFAVKGLVHPNDRCFAVLRYAPDPAGERELAGQRYRRLYHFAEQEAYLREHCPHYLAFDPVCQLELQSVPRASVRRVCDPRARLAELKQSRVSDGQAQMGRERDLVGDLLDLADLLCAESGVLPHALGVSGSLLIGLHTPSSDLDVTVFGRDAGRAVAGALHRLLDGGQGGDLRRLNAGGTAELYAERVVDTSMTFADFEMVEQGKINQGQFRGRPYFLRFVPRPEEIGERYGDRWSGPSGRAGIIAQVTGAAEAIFTPSRYELAEVRFTDGNPVPDLREVISYRGRFCEQARPGDWIRALGTIEWVESRDGERWHRLMVGSAREDTMVRSDESEVELG